MIRLSVLTTWTPALVPLLVFTCRFPIASEEYPDFGDLEIAIEDLASEERYQEAIVLLESVKERFPDRDFEVEEHLAGLYARAGDHRRSLDVWREGHEKGHFFGIDPGGDRFEPFRSYPEFESIVEEDRRLREEANARSRSVIKVATPEEPGTGAPYGMLVVLHGAGSSIERAERQWQSGRLRREFVVAYVQSYWHLGLKTYSWRRHDPRARQDVRQLVEGALAQYPVDRERVIVAGVCAGGTMAIDVALNNVFPTAGFIAVCPGKPQEFDGPRVRLARANGIKGVIIGGERDSWLADEKGMVEVFRTERFPHEFIVIRGMGHTYPPDFSDRLDGAIDYILRLKSLSTAGARERIHW